MNRLRYEMEGVVLVKAARVLLVDDFTQFRKLVRSRLGDDPWLEVIGETDNGTDAIDLILSLRPDVVLLDIGFPGEVSGVEVASKIRTHAPKVKIIFLTEQRDPEVVRAAVMVGDGYVLKTTMVADLLPAMEAVLEGRSFVSPTLGRSIPPL